MREMFDTNAITELAQDKALRDTGKRITRIDEVTRAGVRDRIREAIDEGMGPREAGQHVASWSGWDEYRAERIARTETMFAYNSAAITTYGVVGVTHVVADDGDKDAECAQRHGGTFTLSEAADIHDHPNGTLDWLPVAPGIDAREVQEELSRVRELSVERFIEDTPRPPVVERDPRLVREEIARQAAREAEARLAAERARVARADRVRSGSQDEVLGMFDRGEASFEEILDVRLGVRGSPSEGIPNVVRTEHSSMWDRRHERAILQAIDDARLAGATYRLDVIRLTNWSKVNANGSEVAADMGTLQVSKGTRRPGYPTQREADIMTTVDAQAITFYGDTAGYIGRNGYAEYQIRLADDLLGPTFQRDDFYNVVTHELGHAIEKGAAASSIEANRAIEMIGQVTDPKTRAAYMARIDKELRTTRKYLREQQGFERGMGPVVEGETARMAEIRSSRRMVIEAYQKQEAQLLQMRAQAKELAQAFEIAPTPYAQTNAREDFAESVTLYLIKPRTLEKYNPARYRLIDRIFKGTH